MWYNVHKTLLNTDKSKSIAPILLKIALGLYFVMINISGKFRYNPSTIFLVILKTNQRQTTNNHTETNENITFAIIGGGNKTLLVNYKPTRLCQLFTFLHFVTALRLVTFCRL